jgi:hypothetical protein
LRVGKLAERNAADVGRIGVMVVFNHETEGHRRYLPYAVHCGEPAAHR